MKRWVLVGVIGVCLMAALVSVVSKDWLMSPPPEHKDFGRYRVVKVSKSGGPWQELYFDNTHLSTCTTPSGSWNGPPQPIPDPYCFAIAPDGSSAVYWHETVRRTREDGATAKVSGIYSHSVKAGERLIYKTGDGLHKSWGGKPVGGGLSIGTAPGGRNLVVGFDGRERVE